jgi:sugar O-acyltransferase (sialic acid O-acetyltransferase NeuD family)
VEVEARLLAAPATANRAPDGGVERVLVLGGAGGGGAALILDAIAANPRQRAIGVLDREPSLTGRDLFGVPVLGATDRALEMWRAGAFDAAVIAFNRNLRERAALFAELSAQGVRFTNVIDPTARIGLGARIGTGNVILAFCRVGPNASIGDNNFLSAYVSIEHDCLLGSHCGFGPSVAFSGFVTVGDRVRFGTGIAAEPRLAIGADATIASGVTLTRDVPAGSFVKSRADIAIRTESDNP